MGSKAASNRIDQLMQQGIERRSFPSACLLVGRDGQPVVHRAYGAGGLDTLYDLASLTKVLATTAVTMHLAAEGRLTPETRVAEWIPELDRPETKALRVRHLLGHCSGHPAWLPLFESTQVCRAAAGRRKTIIRKLVAQTQLVYPPGGRTLYSDLSFMLLEWAIERCSGRTLDRAARKLIYEPLGLESLFFVRHNRQGAVETARKRYDIAPTETCRWRKRRLRAEVHDDNAHAMGGVAGHAGLFGTAYAVYRVAHELLMAYRGRRSIFEKQTVQQFFRTRPRRGASRVLGFDSDDEGRYVGALAGRRVVGHLGFTGTSLWLDLDREIVVVLLTNRVYFGREPNPMIAFRPRLHSAIARALLGNRG